MLYLGSLSAQLLISHYPKDFAIKDDTKQSGSWARRQVTAVVDIDCPWWLDWWFGGLHFHAAHHLFPRMCRAHYREATKEIRRVCREHGVVAEHMSFWAALWATLKKLRRVGLKALEKSHGI